MNEQFAASCLRGGIRLTYSGKLGPSNYCHMTKAKELNPMPKTRRGPSAAYRQAGTFSWSAAMTTHRQLRPPGRFARKP
jgi:hypothetical protein